MLRTLIRPMPCRSAGWRPAMSALVVAIGISLAGLAAQPAGDDRAATPSARRLSVPEADALQQAQAAVRGIYEADFARARRAPEQSALGRKLLEEATETNDDPAACFVLLSEARDLGVEAGDPDVIVRSIGEMARRYEVDGLELKAEHLQKASAAARTSAARRAVAQACSGLIHEAVLADRFSVAMEYARAGYAAADKAGDKRLRDQVLAHGQQVLSLEKEFQRVQQAEKTLAETPDDPDANLIRGRYLCLVKEDWDRGLPMLAQGSDPRWQALARKDLAGPTDPPAQLELGDAWWETAQSAKEPAKSSSLGRARRWYLAAMPKLTGSPKSKVIARLAEIKGYGRGPGPSQVGEPAESAASPPSSPPEPLSGEWGDLLKLLDLQKHTAAPAWRLQDGELEALPTGPSARLSIPVVPEGAYDLTVEFTRKVGFGTVGVILPVGSQQCLLALNYRGGPSGLDTVAGQRADNNPSTFAGALSNDRRYTLEVTVRPDGDQVAVNAHLDGRPFLFYRGAIRALELDQEWRLRWRNCLGLVTQSGAVFHSVKLKMVSGKAKLLE